MTPAQRVTLDIDLDATADVRAWKRSCARAMGRPISPLAACGAWSPRAARGVGSPGL